MNPLTPPQTGASKEQRKKMGDSVANEGTRSYTHLCIITSRLPQGSRRQPHRLSNNWSRRVASLKYLVTKRAVENIVGGEHIHMCTERETTGTGDKRRKGKKKKKIQPNSFLAERQSESWDQSFGVLLLTHWESLYNSFETLSGQKSSN